MQIQINTDRKIEGHQALSTKVSGQIQKALSQVSEQITQVRVHVSDENSNKKRGYEVMCCLIEAHLVGRQPMAVTDQADTLDEAVAGATEKLAHLIEKSLARQHDRESHRVDQLIHEMEYSSLS